MDKNLYGMKDDSLVCFENIKKVLEAKGFFNIKWIYVYGTENKCFYYLCG